MRTVVCVLLATATLAACDSFEASRSYRFNGRVVDAETNEPLEGIPVLIARYSSGKTCEFVSNKPCGEGYNTVARIATANDGAFAYAYDVSRLLSSRHQLTVDPCFRQPDDCALGEVNIRSYGSLTDQFIKIPGSNLKGR